MSAHLVSQRHRDQIWSDGYTVFENIVDRHLRDSAVRAINAELGRGISVDEAENFINGACFKELQGREVISDLYNKSFAKHVATELIGDMGHVGGGQIALRFPGMLCIDKESYAPTPWWNKGWHIDGLASKSNSNKLGRIGNFVCLLGVVLQDIPYDFMGNLVVFPGGHRIMEKYVREHGLDDFLNKGDQGLPKRLPLQPARQVTAKAGDIVICHYMLPHSIAPNCSANIRYVVYFRLHLAGHKWGEERYEPMYNIWMDWPQMHETVALKASVEGDKVVRPEDEEVMSLSAVGETLFEEKKYVDAQPIFIRLCQLRTNDIDYHLKAGQCFTWTGSAVDSATGEFYLRRAIHLSPATIIGHCVLARNLTTQQKYFDVVQAVEGAIACAVAEKVHSWMDDLMVDAIKCGIEACDKTTQPAKREAILAIVGKKYSSLLPRIAAVGEAAKLWERGKQFMHAPVKNWVEGQAIFTRLAELEPKAFWAHLQAGICFTYGPETTVIQGEACARRSIELEPTNALGFALLARNLCAQRRWEESLMAIEGFVNARDVGSEHEIFILEATRAARDSCRNLKCEARFLDELMPRLKRNFPHHAMKIDGVARESACCIQ